jgi:transposase
MLKPESNLSIPEETRTVAKAAFPKGNIYLKLRDEIGSIFEDEQFGDLYPSTGQPAESPARLALVTLMQYMENIPDRLAADAVRGRIDWKYMLGLELKDAGFDYSVLSEFRIRLVEGEMSTVLLDKLLESCDELGLLKGKSKQRTDSTHVLAAVRDLTLLELVGETMRMTLNELAVLAPDWLQEVMKPEWVKRYGRRFDGSRLPKSENKRQELCVEIGEDGYFLLESSMALDRPNELSQSKMLITLQKIWIQQYYRDGDGNTHWRTKKNYGQPPANLMISSPQDMDIHLAVKRETQWIGYKVHFTETCEKEHPRLITQVETTNSCIHDVKMTEKIQDDLIARDLRPDVQLVDQGYVEINLLLKSQEKGIDLVGPVASGKSWQSKEENAFEHTQFTIDWEKREATCPAGKKSRWFAARNTRRETPNWVITFEKSICFPCSFRTQCTRATSTGRTLTLYPQREYETQQKARQRQETEAFKKLYRKRAGVEGTISQGVRKNGLRRSRYIGLPRTRLQHLAIAAAINLFRLFDWLTGYRPTETPISPFVALATSAV